MTTVQKRVKEIKLMLKAISMPLIVIEITAYDRKWQRTEFSEVKQLLVEELKTLNIEVNI